MKMLMGTVAILGGLVAPLADASESTGQTAKKTGEYYLVGVGPGDLDLMTIRAVETIARADIVFCNPRYAKALERYLVGKTIHLNHWGRMPFYGLTIDRVAPDDREEFVRITALRDEFIEKVRKYAAQGLTIVVLDGGDPMIYGPYTWTLEEFADLDPKVVPGVSAFNAANAALRKSVTNSRTSKSVTLTATDKFGRNDPIAALAKLRNSMVLFTMRDRFESFIDALLKEYPPDTPLAIVRHAGQRERERVVVTTLGAAFKAIESDELGFEYLIYVGDFLTFRYAEHAEPVKP